MYFARYQPFRSGLVLVQYGYCFLRTWKPSRSMDQTSLQLRWQRCTHRKHVASRSSMSAQEQDWSERRLVIDDLNTLRPRQNGRHFPDDVFKCIFLNGNDGIPIKFSLKFVPNNIPALFQIMAWRRPGDKPLSETMMARLQTQICVTRP